jgi:hypothetical protein
MAWSPPLNAQAGDTYTYEGHKYTARTEPRRRTIVDFPTKAIAIDAFVPKIYALNNGDLATAGVTSDAALLSHFDSSGYNECKFYCNGAFQTYPCEESDQTARCNFYWPSLIDDPDDVEADDWAIAIAALEAELLDFNATAYDDTGDNWLSAWYTANTTAGNAWLTTYPDVNFFSDEAGLDWGDWDMTSISSFAELAKAHFITHGFIKGLVPKYANIWDNSGYRRASATGIAGGDWQTPYDVDPSGFQLDVELGTYDEGYNSDPYATDYGFFNGEIHLKVPYGCLKADDNGLLRWGVSRDGGMKWIMSTVDEETVDTTSGMYEKSWVALESGIYQIMVIDLVRKEVFHLRPELKLCNGTSLVSGQTPNYSSTFAPGHVTAMNSQYTGACSSKSVAQGSGGYEMLWWHDLPAFTGDASNGHDANHNYMLTRYHISTSTANITSSTLAANATYPDFGTSFNCFMALALPSTHSGTVRAGDTVPLALYRDPAASVETANFTKFWAGLVEKPHDSLLPLTQDSELFNANAKFDGERFEGDAIWPSYTSAVSDAVGRYGDTTDGWFAYHRNVILGWTTELMDARSDAEIDYMDNWDSYTTFSSSEGGGTINVGPRSYAIHCYFSKASGTGYGQGNGANQSYPNTTLHAEDVGLTTHRLPYFMEESYHHITTATTPAQAANDGVRYAADAMYGPRMDVTIPAMTSANDELYEGAYAIHGAVPARHYKKCPRLAGFGIGPWAKDNMQGMDGMFFGSALGKDADCNYLKYTTTAGLGEINLDEWGRDKEYSIAGMQVDPPTEAEFEASPAFDGFCSSHEGRYHSANAYKGLLPGSPVGSSQGHGYNYDTTPRVDANPATHNLIPYIGQSSGSPYTDTEALLRTQGTPAAYLATDVTALNANGHNYNPNWPEVSHHYGIPMYFVYMPDYAAGYNAYQYPSRFTDAGAAATGADAALTNYAFGKKWFEFVPDVAGVYKFRCEFDIASVAASWGSAGAVGSGCSSEYLLVVAD